MQGQGMARTDLPSASPGTQSNAETCDGQSFRTEYTRRIGVDGHHPPCPSSIRERIACQSPSHTSPSPLVVTVRRRKRHAGGGLSRSFRKAHSTTSRRGTLWRAAYYFAEKSIRYFDRCLHVVTMPIL